jgi:hypothetical protein
MFEGALPMKVSNINVPKSISLTRNSCPGKHDSEKHIKLMFESITR